MEPTMLTITTNFLLEKETATFNQVYQAVAKELKLEWKKQNPKKLMSEIELDKKAELYTLITASGQFIRMSNSKFGLARNFTYEEIQKMKVNQEEEL